MCADDKNQGKKKKESEIWLGNRIGWAVCLVEIMKTLSNLFQFCHLLH